VIGVNSSYPLAHKLKPDSEIIEATTHVVVSQEVLDMADDFLESISELFGMTEEHNNNVSTEVVSETSVNEVVEAEVYEEISLFDFV